MGYVGGGIDHKPGVADQDAEIFSQINMVNHTFLTRLLALSVLAGALIFSCTKNPPSTMMGPPVVKVDTVPQIAGWYSGYSILDEYAFNTRQGYYVIINVDSVGDTVGSCPRTFVLILDDGNSTPQVVNATGDPRKLTWDCFDGIYHNTFTGSADGRSISGSVYQYKRAASGAETLSFIVTFSARKP